MARGEFVSGGVSDASDKDHRAAANAARAILEECPGIEIKVVRPFGLPNGSAKGLDVCDWTGGPEELQALIDRAEAYGARSPGEPLELPPRDPDPQSEEQESAPPY